jgi:hypothetical protein
MFSNLASSDDTGLMDDPSGPSLALEVMVMEFGWLMDGVKIE